MRCSYRVLDRAREPRGCVRAALILGEWLQVTGGQDAKAVKDALSAEHGIMVRHYAKKELSGYIRISVGRPEDTRKLLSALQGMAGPAASPAPSLEKE